MFNAQANPDALSATIQGLTPAKLYTFRVYSVNFNGKSLASNEFSIYACGLPRQFGEPTYVDSTATWISFNWIKPLDDGGCPIFDYTVYRDATGAGLTWEEVNPAGTYPRYDPNMDFFKCEIFPSTAVAGDPFRFKVKGTNL